MKTNKLKIINKKKPNNYEGVTYSKIRLIDPVPLIGNFNLESLTKPIKLPQKYYMTITDNHKIENKRKYYYNKIKN